MTGAGDATGTGEAAGGAGGVGAGSGAGAGRGGARVGVTGDPPGARRRPRGRGCAAGTAG
ncbi:hypothetical protein DDJ31_01210 [Streptomyces griseoviridis]|uniref:Uncharacterized protein n=1 Tax=Streptomyces griseoviridis TaxID=45398 RepID=A0ABX5TQK1_STRGD|nr:hypothetical protein DDJ31_01210 [Streptomyces griseoviridis]